MLTLRGGESISFIGSPYKIHSFATDFLMESISHNHTCYAANIIYFIIPRTDIPESSESSIKLAEIIENISRIISLLLLLFLAKNPNANLENP